MTRTHIDIKTSDGVCNAYLTAPEGMRSPPVLLFMDAIGLRPVLEAMADRIAANGYCVLAPNLFYRIGRTPPFTVAEITQPENRPRLMEIITALTPDKVIADAGVFLDVLAARPESAGGKAGLTGYCMGGSMALRTAAAFPERVAAVASFHAGRLVSDAPDSPHRLVGKITAELYFGHADQDTGMTAEQIKTLDAALTAAGCVFEAELYVGAKHGYTMPDAPPYDAAACDKHWRRLLGLLGKTLKAV